MTEKVSEPLYTRRSSGSARHDRLPNLEVKELVEQHTPWQIPNELTSNKLFYMDRRVSSVSTDPDLVK